MSERPSTRRVKPSELKAGMKIPQQGGVLHTIRSVGFDHVAKKYLVKTDRNPEGIWADKDCQVIVSKV